MIDIAIAELIKANSLVQAEIGEHIYPGVVPSDVTGPAIRYYLDDKPSELTGMGVEAKKKSDIQIDVFHNSYTKNRQISQSIQTQFHGFKGQQSAINFNLIEFLDSTPFFDEQTREHRTTITLTCTFKET